MKKLSIVTNSNSETEKLKINVADKKIYYNKQEGSVVLIEGSLRYKKSKPTGEIDEIDVLNTDLDLSFPLCGKLSEETKELIAEAYTSIFDNSMIAREVVCFMG